MTPQRREVRSPRRTPPQFEITKSPDFKSIYTTGVFGGTSPNDCRIIFYQDRLEPAILPGGAPGQMTTKNINRELQAEVHMTPVAFKSLAQWMNQHVKTFEERFGEIMGSPSPDKDNPLVQ